MNLVQDMLAAAAQAAGAHWQSVRGDLESFVQDLAANAAQVGAAFKAGTTTAEDLREELQDLGNEAVIIGRYADQAAKLAAEAALNAAIDVAEAAIKAGTI